MPANVDPAPLLYPIFVPVLVMWSTQSQNSHIAISNYILSLATLPSKTIPFYDFHFHWIISLLPLFYQSTVERLGLSRSLEPSIIQYPKTDAEEEVLLFPLHIALLQTLGFLTTTSLLPTELQLLSVGLINLLYFGRTPHSLILKGLLWIGGVVLVATCRHVLQLSVELARVPSWRFRRRNRYRSSKSTVLCALDDTFGAWLTSVVKPKRLNESSDEDWTLQAPQSNLSKDPNHAVESVRHSSPKSRRLSHASLDDLAFSEQESRPEADNIVLVANAARRRRRHTLPSHPVPLPDLPALTKTATDALSSARVRSKLLVRLTASQAAVLKWLYAAFVYLMVVVIILVPVRLFVGYSALNGQEPVGWALGYLLGDLSSFRLQVVLMNLERWICLPERLTFPPERVKAGEWFRIIMLGTSNTRLVICAWCITNIVFGLITVFRLSNVAEVDTRRKVFHGMMVSMFLPSIFVDPTFVALALALILAIFLLLDLFRAAQLPPLSKPLTYFLAPYVDGRDHRGPIVISHMFLLIGCAIPLWLSLADVKRTGVGAFKGWDVETRDMSMVSGVICVGMGDAAASLIGRRYGHRRWPWSGGKSLEGSAAFAVAVTIGLLASRMWLALGAWNGDNGDAWLTTITKSTIAACGASLTEAVLTGGNDNVIVPIILWLLVRGLRI